MAKLTIVILSYNVKPLLENCLNSVKSWPIIVVDNASTDGSVQMVKDKFPAVKVLETGKNLGFAAGNNFAAPHINSEFVLFLNPDTEVKGKAIELCLDFLENNTKFGAATCKVELPDGKLDYSCHRGLPTPMNSLFYFLGLARLLPKSKLFAGYTATYLDISKAHEIECATGAFLLVRKTAGDAIGWWDEDYFWNGDDIEFCYKLKAYGYKIMYLPSEKIIHYKGSSSVSSPEARALAAKSSTQAMKVFMDKHYRHTLGKVFIDAAIFILEKYRVWIKYR